ncbi:hypothetical protein DERF_005388 [Dermatophagoides farinae]|uniref:Uncharacterized protein n=1 Tax=Dermatophagoides farinae TaxID=6954 RepID=A0A922L646_DERFA|nr:hypothetical protein DERF_005388 [Dermatophagoides farinae]
MAMKCQQHYFWRQCDNNNEEKIIFSGITFNNNFQFVNVLHFSNKIEYITSMPKTHTPAQHHHHHEHGPLMIQ